MLYRRLEDQIRELCAKALATPDSEQEFFSVMTQLKAALHEHTKRLRGMIGAQTPNRRSSNWIRPLH
jgi:hypothetical protein